MVQIFLLNLSSPDSARNLAKLLAEFELGRRLRISLEFRGQVPRKKRPITSFLLLLFLGTSPHQSSELISDGLNSPRHFFDIFFL